jgi:integrase
MRASILHEIDRGTFDYAATFPLSKHAEKFAVHVGDVKLVGVYLESWLARQRKHLKASTFNGYRKVVYGHLIPWFGDLKVSQVTKRGMRERLDALRSTNKTLANIQSVFRKALSDAIDDEVIDTNPLADWCYKRAEAPKLLKKVDPFSPDEVKAILAHCDGQGHNLLQFAFWTGMRTSELVALDWCDVDFERGVVTVSRAKTQSAIVPESPKTAAGNREIPLLRMAREALIDQMRYTFAAGKEVFQNPRTQDRWAGDQPIRKSLWVPALKRAGVRYRRPYQTRHTFASLMLMANENPMGVSALMGHRDWSMISRVYATWIPHADNVIGKRVEEMFSPTYQE